MTSPGKKSYLERMVQPREGPAENQLDHHDHFDIGDYDDESLNDDDDGLGEGVEFESPHHMSSTEDDDEDLTRLFDLEGFTRDNSNNNRSSSPCIPNVNHRPPTGGNRNGYSRVEADTAREGVLGKGWQIGSGGLPSLEQGESSRTWIKVLATLTCALFLDVVILATYVFNVEPKELEIRVEAQERWRPLPSPRLPLRSLAFGSSSHQTQPQGYWDSIAKFAPDLMVLAGDNVYGNCVDANCTALKDAYKDWDSHPSLVGAKEKLSVVAAMDDHDYGLSDADENNPYKDIAKNMFLDFFHIQDERRTRTNDGVYKAFEWGPVGKRTQLIILDTRYSRSKFLPTDRINGAKMERYKPDYVHTNKRMLSEDQWEWLAAQMIRKANLRVIVSPIQVLADGTGYECWRMLPHERDRLTKILKDAGHSSLTVILSGDRKVGGFYRDFQSNLIEVTSSSLTHTMPVNAYGECRKKGGCDEKDPKRLDNFVRANNFGTVEIDWKSRNVTLALRSVDASPLLQYHKGVPDAGDPIQLHIHHIP